MPAPRIKFATQSKKQGGVNAALLNEWSVFRDQ